MSFLIRNYILFFLVIPVVVDAKDFSLDELLAEQDKNSLRIDSVLYKGQPVSAKSASELCFALGYRRVVSVDKVACGNKTPIFYLKAESQLYSGSFAGAVQMIEGVCHGRSEKIEQIECAGP